MTTIDGVNYVCMKPSEDACYGHCVRIVEKESSVICPMFKVSRVNHNVF